MSKRQMGGLGKGESQGKDKKGAGSRQNGGMNRKRDKHAIGDQLRESRNPSTVAQVRVGEVF